MTTYAISPDTDHGTWAPMTRRRAEMMAEDERTSDDLARRLGLRSWRERHPEAPSAQTERREREIRALEAKAARRCACGSPGPVNGNGNCQACRLRLWRETKGTTEIKPGYHWGTRTVLRESPVRTANRKVQYQVRCDCGRNDLVAGHDIRRGLVGRCLRCTRERLAERLRQRAMAR